MPTGSSKGRKILETWPKSGVAAYSIFKNVTWNLNAVRMAFIGSLIVFVQSELPLEFS